MIASIILLLLGFLLVFIEFYLPGGILGVAGGILIFGALILFAVESDSMIATVAFVIGSAVAFTLLIKFTIWKIQHTSAKYSIYSNHNQQNYYASKNLPQAIGRTAKAMTDLRPGGYIDLDGERIQAISRSGYITNGSDVEIIACEEESLIVKIKR